MSCAVILRLGPSGWKCMRVALLACVLGLVQPGPGAVAQTTLSVIEYGLYARGAERVVPDPSAPFGQSRQALGDRFRLQTRQVPLELGVGLGFCFSLRQDPGTRSPAAMVRVTHPEMVRSDGSRHSGYTMTLDLDRFEHNPCVGYGFDHRSELVPGTWRFDVVVNGTVLTSQESFSGGQRAARGQVVS